MNRTTAIRWFNKIVDNLTRKGYYDEPLGYNYMMSRKRDHGQFRSAYLTFKGQYVTVFDDVKIERTSKNDYILILFWVGNQVHTITDIRKV